MVHEKMPYVRSVAIGIWVKAGSAFERDEEWGISHFIEHMLFKGTPTRTARMIAEQFDRIGGDINAYTSKELTCYTTTVLDYHAEEAMDILADMFFHSVFDEKEMQREKTVILDEIASVEDTPDDDVDERLWSVMYPSHPIGRSIGGEKTTINRFDKDMIKRYMDEHYIPHNIVISVAGNYDDKLIDKIIKHFGAFEKSSKGIVHKESAPVFHGGSTIKRKEIEQAHICLAYPGLPLKDDHLYDLILLDSIVGGTMSSRLFQEIREERGLAYSVYSYYSSYLSTGSFVIYGGTSPEHLEEMVSMMDSIIGELIDKGVSARELTNAKEQLKGSFLLGLESSESRMNRNGNNELIIGEHRTIDEVVALIDKVNISDVNKMAQTIFSCERAVSIISPYEQESESLN